MSSDAGGADCDEPDAEAHHDEPDASGSHHDDPSVGGPHPGAPGVGGSYPDAPGTDDTAVTLGFVLAVLATLGPLLAIWRGVMEPVVIVSAVTGSAATAGFLASRYGVLDRRTGTRTGAIGSLLTGVLLAVAIAIGSGVGSRLPGPDWPVSVTFVSLLAAVGAVSFGVAAYGGVTRHGLRRRAGHLLEMGTVGVLGFVAYVIAVVFLQTLLLVIVAEPTEPQRQFVNYLGFAVGIGGVALGYLEVSGKGTAFLDLHPPTRRAWLWIVGGTVAIIAGNIGVGALLAATSVEQAGHTTVGEARENLAILAVVVPAMVLIVGPAEELLYRNVIQKSLYASFSRVGAIALTSVVFAAVHVSAYATAGTEAILVSLSVVFAFSLVLGVIYERTGNLVVPALIHGLYNAAVFLSILV